MPRKKTEETAVAAEAPAAGSVASVGDLVTVHYVGTLKSGEVFDRATTEHPFSFVIGGGQVLPTLEKEVAGMRIGERKTFTIGVRDAYGAWSPINVTKVDRSAFPPDHDVAVGKWAQITRRDGKPVRVKVTEIDGEKITLDANHPLSGWDLTFDLTLVAIGA